MPSKAPLSDIRTTGKLSKLFRFLQLVLIHHKRSLTHFSKENWNKGNAYPKKLFNSGNFHVQIHTWERKKPPMKLHRRQDITYHIKLLWVGEHINSSISKVGLHLCTCHWAIEFYVSPACFYRHCKRGQHIPLVEKFCCEARCIYHRTTGKTQLFHTYKIERQSNWKYAFIQNSILVPHRVLCAWACKNVSNSRSKKIEVPEWYGIRACST